MGRRYRGGRGTALRPRRRAGPRTGFSPRRRGTGTPRPAREPETKRTVFAAILLRPSLRCKRETRSLGFLCPPLLSPLLLVPLPGRRAHARRPTWAVMDSGATVGGTRERAASSGKGHVEGKFSRARPRGYRALSLSLFIGWEGLFWILLYIISPRVDGIHSSNVYFLRNISLL